jgi:hypothetical protein
MVPIKGARNREVGVEGGGVGDVTDKGVDIGFISTRVGG